jgi:hypothetical protein
MAKLTKAQREDLASLINSLVVANDMRDHALVKEDLESWDLWDRAIARDTLELFEAYGIELPNLSYIQQRNAA